MIKRPLCFYALSFCLSVLSNEDFAIKWLNELSHEEAISIIENEAQELFVRSFFQAYRMISLKDLRVSNLHDFLVAAYEDEPHDFVHSTEHCWCVTVRNKENVLVGVAFVDPLDTPDGHQVYFRQLAVDPGSWGQGIGRLIVHTVIEKCTKARRIVLVTRRINTGAIAFYKSLGFINCELSHGSFDPEVYCGMEYCVPGR